MPYIKTNGLLIAALIISASAAHGACNSATIAAQAPSSRYTYTAGGAEVEDARTGLVWQRCAIGQSFNDNSTPSDITDDSCTGSATSQNWQVAVEDVTGSWRLPNIKELASLLAAECSSPALNDSVFLSAPAQKMWSASPDTANADQAWMVDFASGDVAAQVKDAASTSSRLVRETL